MSEVGIAYDGAFNGFDVFQTILGEGPSPLKMPKHSAVSGGMLPEWEGVEGGNRRQLGNHQTYLHRVIAMAVAVAISTLIFSVTAAASGTTSLNSKLLTIHEMPKGWLTTSSPAARSPLKCGDVLWVMKNDTHQFTRASFYDRSKADGLPTISESLGRATSPKRIFDDIVGQLRCPREHTTIAGERATVVFGQESFGSFGNESYAASVVVSTIGASVTEDIVIVRVGNVLVHMDLSDDSGSNARDVPNWAHLVGRAVSKVASTGS